MTSKLSSCRKALLTKLANEDSVLAVNELTSNLYLQKVQAKIQELKEGIEKRKKELEERKVTKRELETQIEDCFMQLEGRRA